MAGHIPAPLILDAMDAVMDAHGPDPDLVRGLMGIGALAHHGLLPRTGEEAGREEKVEGPTGLGHGLDLLVASGVTVLVEENHFPGNWGHMN